MKNITLRAWVASNRPYLTTHRYNTNNAWGFGGSSGIEHRLPDGKTFIRIGRASSRHSGTSKCCYAGERLSTADANYRFLRDEAFFERAKSVNPRSIDS